MSPPGTPRRVSFSTALIHRLRSTRLRSARLLGAVAAVSLVAAACGGSNPAALQDIPGTTRQQMISDRNNPAVQIIVTQYKATVTAPTLGVNDAALNALAQQVGQQAAAGQIGSDQKSLVDSLVNGIAANPAAYFTAGAPVQTSATATFQCTGSVVTPDGYIVTAAHCTQPASDELHQAYVQTGLKPILDATIQGIKEGASDLTADQQKKLADAAASFVADKAQVSGEQKSIFTGLFSSSSSGNREVTKKTLSVVTQGTAPKSSDGPFGEKDVSILKLDGYNNLPTLPITGDADVSSGQPLYVDGYPGNAENGNLDNLSTPTVTAGSVSAKKTSDAGVPLIETTATVSGGNSGGPGFDQDGAMIGVVSYGTSSNGA
ncbi:MAG TPA: serine protease, partial [Candidatus Binatia bacterium]|nr:serine protease [Candidatus Binatia bacterium]